MAGGSGVVETSFDVTKFALSSFHYRLQKCCDAVTGLASEKSNPLSVPQGYVYSYSTLGHVGGVNRCGGYTLLRVTTHRLTGLSST